MTPVRRGSRGLVVWPGAGPRYHGRQAPPDAVPGPFAVRVRRSGPRDREARRRPGEPGQPVRGDAPQHRLDGARPARRPGRAVRPRPPARRVLERSSCATRASSSILAKPQTYMNDSGVAVRKLLARDRVPLVDLLVVADDFALPFGKLRFRESGSHGGHNGLRSIIDELGTEKYARLRVGIGEPGRGRRRPRPVASSRRTSGRACRSCSTPPPMPWRRGRARGRRRPRTGSTRSSCRRRRRRRGDPGRRSRARSAGPPTSPGVRRTKTGWRRILGGDGGTAATERRRPTTRAGGAALSDRYRGRTTRQRNVAEKVAREWAERRAAAEAGEQQVDLDRASAEAEVELLDPAARPDAGARAAPSRARRRAGAADRASQAIAARPRAGRGRRVPDLAALPRLLHDDGLLRDAPRAARAGRRRRRCTAGTSGLTSVPHGAKSYLAAALALARRTPSGSAGWRATRRSATGSRRSWGRGWATRRSSRCSSRGRRSRTSAASSSPTRRPRGSRRSRRGGPARRRSSSRASRRCSRRRSRPDDLPGAAPHAQAGHADRPGRAPRRAPRARLHAGPRGRGPRRVRAARRHRGRVPAVARRSRSGSSSSATRSTRCARSTPPTSGASRPVRELALLPATEFLLPAGGADDDPGAARPAGRAGCRSASRSTSRGSPARPRPERPAAVAGGRALAAGDAAEVWARLIAPSTGLDHLDPATLLVLDEPGDLADAADFLWRQADERHARARGAGRPAARLADGLPPAARLEGAPPRRADAGAHLAVRGGRGARAWPSRRRASPRATCSAGASPSCRPGARSALVDGVEHWLGERARVVLVSRPGAAPRGAPGRGRSPRRHRQPGRRGAAAGRHRARRAQPQRRLRGRPGRPGGRHRPRAVRDRPRPAAEGDAPRRPARHPRAPDAPATSSSTSTTASPATSRCCGAARRARSATTSSSRSRRATGSSSPWSRSTGSAATRGGEHPQLVAARRHRLAAHQAAGPQGRHRPRRGAARPVREARGGRGLRLRRDSPWQAEMEASFPYEETPDQLRAAIEVKVDMEARRPMDRLVVGDVGYGKTEVALRAAFKATQDGKQVAVLVPTTVLAEQHFNTFSQRFAAFPINVRLLSRFVCGEGAGRDGRGAGGGQRGHRDRHAPAAVARTSRSRTWAWWSWTRSSGSASRHKERLKQLRSAVDVLTLTRHADPADAQPGAGGHPGPVRHRDAARGPAADPDPGRGGVGRAGPRRDPARAGPRRPGVLRPQPGRDDRGAGRAAAAAAARARGSSSATGRWARARSRR